METWWHIHPGLWGWFSFYICGIIPSSSLVRDELGLLLISSISSRLVGLVRSATNRELIELIERKGLVVGRDRRQIHVGHLAVVGSPVEPVMRYLPRLFAYTHRPLAIERLCEHNILDDHFCVVGKPFLTISSPTNLTNRPAISSISSPTTNRTNREITQFVSIRPVDSKRIPIACAFHRAVLS